MTIQNYVDHLRVRQEAAVAKRNELVEVLKNYGSDPAFLASKAMEVAVLHTEIRLLGEVMRDLERGLVEAKKLLETDAAKLR